MMSNSYLIKAEELVIGSAAARSKFSDNLLWMAGAGQRIGLNVGGAVFVGLLPDIFFIKIEKINH